MAQKQKGWKANVIEADTVAVAGLTPGEAANLVAACDWPTCSLGPFAGWPPALRAAIRMMLASKFPMFITWGENFPYLYNDACIPIVGDRHPQAFGRPFAAVWPEVWDELSPLLRQAQGGEASFHENMQVMLERDGDMCPAWFTFSYSPLFDDEGLSRGVLSVAMEGTETVLALKRQSLRNALDDELRDLVDPAEIAAAAARLLGTHLGCQHCFFAELEADADFASVAGGWSDGQSPAWAGRHTVASLRAGGALSVPLMKAGAPHVLVCGSRAAPGRWSAEEEAAAREIGERAWAVIERSRAEAAVHEAARELRLLTDALPVLISYVDSGERYRFNNRAYEEWFGRPRDVLHGKHLTDVIGAAAYADLKPIIDRALAGEALSLEKTIPFRDGGTRHVHIDYVPRLDLSGVVLGYYALVQDIGERKRAEEHRQLLVNELNHRVRNTLAVVQSLAAQTFKTGTDMAVARKDFEGRLAALAAAHNLLTSENWDGASLGSVVRESVRVGADHARFTIAGPDIRLSPQTAVSLALAVHELCTNAVKYGALSVPAGHVSIVWHVYLGEDGQTRLDFAWKETGGPAVVAPARRGFGSRLLENGLAAELRGTVTMIFDADGVACHIDAPLPAPRGNT